LIVTEEFNGDLTLDEAESYLDIPDLPEVDSSRSLAACYLRFSAILKSVAMRTVITPSRAFAF
jgi:hypothetical protein